MNQLHSENIFRTGAYNFFIFALAIAVPYAIILFSKQIIFQSFFPSGISPSLSQLFEADFWQFSIALLGILFLSRGHLWSYGICSDNLKRSMLFLGAGYIFSALLFLLLRLFEVELVAFRYAAAAPREDKLMLMLIQWMSSPVADQILFFGLAQTFLVKFIRWNSKLHFLQFIVPILISTTLFAALRTTLPMAVDSIINTIAVITAGAYSSFVYSKTRSLLAPMLFQAFFFGLPFFIAFFPL